MLELSLDDARALHLAAQGLARRPRRRARKSDVLETIRQMGVLQIDTIHVVARSPYLVLWSRLGAYEPRWLDELLAEGKLFEYWAHEACFLPIEDYPLFRHRMLAPRGMGWKYPEDWVEANRDVLERVLAHVREHGAVRSADFERRDDAGGWWGWKPEKRALESLFTSGALMVARRERFQRVYDLRERVLPTWDDAMLPDPEEAARTLALRAVRALGVTPARWVADYYRTARRETIRRVEALARDGAILPVRVEGADEPWFVHPDRRELAEEAAAGAIRPTLTTLLSPFDPVVWDRERALALFDFDYRLECYTPAPKRKYGYFVLPILHRGRLVGRLDAKAHRSDGVFEIKTLYLEPRVRPTPRLAADLARAFRDAAEWHGTPTVRITKTEPEGFGRLLEDSLATDGG